MTFLRACALSALDVNKPVRAKVDGVNILVAKTPAGIVAFPNMCTHADYPLHAGKWDADECLLTCPAHGAVFSLIAREGSAAGTPIVGPAVLPLEIFETEVRNDEGEPAVYVNIDDAD